MITRKTDYSILADYTSSKTLVLNRSYRQNDGSKRDGYFASISIGTIGSIIPKITVDGELQEISGLSSQVFEYEQNQMIIARLSINLATTSKDVYLTPENPPISKYVFTGVYSISSIEILAVNKEDKTNNGIIIAAQDHPQAIEYDIILATVNERGGIKQIVYGDLSLNFFYQSGLSEGAYGYDVYSGPTNNESRLGVIKEECIITPYN